MTKLSQEYYSKVYRHIGDSPQNVVINHSLIQKHATVHYSGSIDKLQSMIVETPYEPGEPFCFGIDEEEIIDLLENVEKLVGFSVANANANKIIEKYYEKHGIKLTKLNCNTFVLENKPKQRSTKAVLLDMNDLDIINRASNHFDWFGFMSGEDMLRAGLISGIIKDNELVSVAYTSAFTEKYVDIGIRTKKQYRSRGYASDAAAKVIEATLSMSKVPVWNVMEDNYPSIAICKKLGFRKVNQEHYFS